MNKLKALWASLPKQVQTILIVFGTAAGTVLAKECQALLFGTESFSVSTLRHDLGAAAVAGFLAARCFFMLPNHDGAAPAPPPSPEVK